MSEPQKSCPKCRGRMEEGFLPDWGDGNRLRTSQWQEGLPEKSFWFGLKTGDKRRYQIRSYRCTGCGYLESYADVAVE